MFDNDERFHDLTEHLRAVDEITRLEEMRIEGFVSQYKIPPARILGSYWVGPTEGSGQVLRLLYAAMRSEHQGAIVRWTKRTRQALGVIVTSGEGLILLELSWASLVRDPRPEVQAMTDRDVPGEQIKLARELVQAMMVDVETLDDFEDQGWLWRHTLRERALAGEDPPVPQREADQAPAEKLAEALR